MVFQRPRAHLLNPIYHQHHLCTWTCRVRTRKSRWNWQNISSSSYPLDQVRVIFISLPWPCSGGQQRLCIAPCYLIDRYPLDGCSFNLGSIATAQQETIFGVEERLFTIIISPQYATGCVLVTIQDYSAWVIWFSMIKLLIFSKKMLATVHCV